MQWLKRFATGGHTKSLRCQSVVEQFTRWSIAGLQQKSKTTRKVQKSARLCLTGGLLETEKNTSSKTLPTFVCSTFFMRQNGSLRGTRKKKKHTERCCALFSAMLFAWRQQRGSRPRRSSIRSLPRLAGAAVQLSSTSLPYAAFNLLCPQIYPVNSREKAFVTSAVKHKKKTCAEMRSSRSAVCMVLVRLLVTVVVVVVHYTV